MTDRRHTLGQAAEAAAAEFLARAGLRVIERNVRFALGELDLVCRDGDAVVFVEVKCRQARWGDTPAAAVSWHKRRRLVQLAQLYLKTHGLADARCRFDVVAVTEERRRPARHPPPAGGLRRLLSAGPLQDATLRRYGAGRVARAPRGRYTLRVMTARWDAYRTALPSIAGAVGRTPLVRLNRIAAAGPPIYVKVEWYGPSGSLKDRIYLHMFEQAEARGDLRPGIRVLECSTGNAGIACAFVAAVKGYPCTVVMPEGMSEERKKIMRAYGAELVFTPGGESDVDLSLQKLEAIRARDPGGYWVPGQFANADNVDAHYRTTGPEIWEQTGGIVGAFVAAQGSGGTLSGVGRALRERDGHVKLYAVEPEECALLARRAWGPHGIEGIGDGFIPDNLDVALLTGVITTSTEESVEHGPPAGPRGRALLRNFHGVQRGRRRQAGRAPPGAALDRHHGERHRPALLHHAAVRRGQARGGARAGSSHGRADAPRAGPPPGALGDPDLKPAECDFVAARRRLEAKAKSAGEKLTTVEDAVARVKDGDHVAVGGCLFSRTPMALVREILRQRRRGLTLSRNLMCTEGEFFMVAGGVERVVTAWMSIGLPWGVSKILRHYVESGKVALEEWSHLALGLRFRAAAMGVPFLPALTMLGSDLVERRAG